MSIQEREYMRESHPSHCTCVDCEKYKRRRNLSDTDKEKLDKALRKASKKTKFYNIIYAVTTTLVVGALISTIITNDAVWLGEAISNIQSLFEHLLTSIKNR
jgi:hypothetical protein